ncbi:hypothetical protein GCM10027157_18030 [Corynebacterium aquatimens]
MGSALNPFSFCVLSVDAAFCSGVLVTVVVSVSAEGDATVVVLGFDSVSPADPHAVTPVATATTAAAPSVAIVNLRDGCFIRFIVTGVVDKLVLPRGAVSRDAAKVLW